MDDPGQLFTAGIWTVKPGRETDFIRAWEEFARWTAEHQPGAGEARLLQEVDKPNRFLSFGPWESAESIQSWRSRSEFSDFFAQARQLCEEIQPRTLKLAVHIPRATGQ